MSDVDVLKRGRRVVVFRVLGVLVLGVAGFFLVAFAPHAYSYLLGEDARVDVDPWGEECSYVSGHGRGSGGGLVDCHASWTVNGQQGEGPIRGYSTSDLNEVRHGRVHGGTAFNYQGPVMYTLGLATPAPAALGLLLLGVSVLRRPSPDQIEKAIASAGLGTRLHTFELKDKPFIEMYEYGFVLRKGPTNVHAIRWGETRSVWLTKDDKDRKKPYTCKVELRGDDTVLFSGPEEVLVPFAAMVNKVLGR